MLKLLFTKSLKWQIFLILISWQARYCLGLLNGFIPRVVFKLKIALIKSHITIHRFAHYTIVAKTEKHLDTTECPLMNWFIPDKKG